MNLADIETTMQKTVEATQRNFNTIRTGRANPSLLDRVQVEYYGVPTPLKSLATISTPDASTILIQPFDRKSLGLVEKSISLSDIGLVPNNDGSLIRLNIPPLTSDRRKELVKSVAKLAEEGKVSIRNIRRDAVDTIRKQEKNQDISEDEVRSLQDKIQKMTNKYIAKIEELQVEKEKDITTALLLSSYEKGILAKNAPVNSAVAREGLKWQSHTLKILPVHNNLDEKEDLLEEAVLAIKRRQENKKNEINPAEIMH